jgi:RNA polymerase sigma factor (sigma-70 family)
MINAAKNSIQSARGTRPIRMRLSTRAVASLPAGSNIERKPVEGQLDECMAATDYKHTADDNWQAELVARCQSGEERAFESLAEAYGSMLLRTAYLLVQDEEAAKDLVQESFIQAWKKIGQLREPTALRAWLLKILINHASSLKRQLARKSALLRAQLLQSSVDAAILSTDFERGRHEEEIDLAQALERLPLKHRTVLILFYYQRMSMPEISSLLGVGENTLRKRLQAALGKMRRMLETPAFERREMVNESISTYRRGV